MCPKCHATNLIDCIAMLSTVTILRCVRCDHRWTVAR